MADETLGKDGVHSASKRGIEDDLLVGRGFSANADAIFGACRRKTVKWFQRLLLSLLIAYATAGALAMKKTARKAPNCHGTPLSTNALSSNVL